MITRRIIGLIILAVIIIVGFIIYCIAKKKVSYIESEMVIRTKDQLKGKKNENEK